MDERTIIIGEYIVTIDYDGNGGIDVEVLDELGEIIEGLYISNSIPNPGSDITDNLNNN
jgi:hypothetical protein